MPTNILQNFVGFMRPDISKDGKLNPVHLSNAIRGYWIQSHVFHIPDRFGFFSPGPPRLQAYQGCLLLPLLFMVMIQGLVAAFQICLVLCSEEKSPYGLRGLVVLFGIIFASVAIFWIAFLFDEHRAADYEWGDWKPHQD